MAIVFPQLGRRPVLTVTLPSTAAKVTVILRNETTGKRLRLNVPAGANLTLVLDFLKATITDGAGVNRSSYLDPIDNLLWVPEPLLPGVSNDLRIEPVLPAPATIVTAAVAQMYDIAIDATFIYWADSQETGRIGRSKLDGTEPLPNFIKPGGFPNGIAVDGTTIYWTDFTAQKIRKAALAGGAASDLVTGLTNLQAITVDATFIYFTWSEAGTTKIGRCKLSGAEVNKSFITLGTVVGPGDDLAVNATHIYWCNNLAGGSLIGRAKIGGTEVLPELVKTGVGYQPMSLALDANYLWVGDEAYGLCRVPLARPEYQNKVAYDSTSGWIGMAGGVAVNAGFVFFGKTRSIDIGRMPIYSAFVVAAKMRWEKGYF